MLARVPCTSSDEQLILSMLNKEILSHEKSPVHCQILRLGKSCKCRLVFQLPQHRIMTNTFPPREDVIVVMAKSKPVDTRLKNLETDVV